MIQEGGSTPVMVSGGGGWGGDGCGFGGGILGLILILALFGGCGFGGFGRGCNDGRNGCGEYGGGYAFGLQKDVLENRYTSEKNTLAIIESQNCNTGKILDKMTGIEMQNLRDKISGLETALSEQRITATILTNLQPPRAIPSYPAPNPYVPYGYENKGCGFPAYGC